MYVHKRHRRSIPLGDVGSYNPPPLGARRPRRHTSDQGLALAELRELKFSCKNWLIKVSFNLVRRLGEAPVLDVR